MTTIDHHSHPAAPPARHPTVEIRSGPSVRSPVGLGVGRHLVGRARGCSILIDDPEIEPHQLTLDVGPDEVRLTVLCGRLPVLVDGRPMRAGDARSLGHRSAGIPGDATDATETTDATDPDGDSTVIEIGQSAVAIRWRSDGVGPTISPGGDAPAPPGDGSAPPGDGSTSDGGPRTVRRGPRERPEPVEVVLSVPDPPACDVVPPPSATMLATSASTLVVGLVMAVVLGHPLFALFALTGATVAGVTWTVGRVRSARSRRSADDAAFAHDAEIQRARLEAVATARRRHLLAQPAVPDVLAMSVSDRRWERRPAHGDAFTVTLGHGVHAVATRAGTSTDRDRSEPPSELVDVPVPVALDGRGPNGSGDRVVTVSGPGASAVVRSMLTQLAVTTGPADWRLVLAVQGDELDELAGLPHAIDAPRTIEDPCGDDGTRLVVVTDEPDALTARSSPLRRLLGSGREVTMIVLATDERSVPAVCDTAVHVGARWRGRWRADLDAPAGSTVWTPGAVHLAGIDRATCRAVVSALSGLVDPEAPEDVLAEFPDAVDLASLPGMLVDADAIAGRWAAGGRDPAVSAPIGRTASGVLEIDLVRDGPHGLIAGTTGSGKSELLRSLVVSLAAACSPAHLAFVLVDYKGGATFDACASLPHTVGLVTDLDAGAAERALVGLESELRRRERCLRAVGAADLTEYRSAPGTPPLARLVVVIDEFAALVSEVPGFVPSLVGLAQRGRSLGIHLLLATQRPAGVVDDAIRANTDLRIALRLNDTADARDVVGIDDPARFERDRPGRALLRLAQHRPCVFQAATSTAGPTPTLRAVVAATREAAARSGIPGAPSPWLPSLADLGPIHGDRLPSLLTVGTPASVASSSGERDRRDRRDGRDAEDANRIGDAVGLLDDPAGQCRRPLVWARDGNLALVGALGSGTTTTLVALGTRAASAGAELHAIDARGDGGLDVLVELDTCAGVVGLHERERLWRMVTRLVDTIDARRHAGECRRSDRGEVVVVIDGLVTLRRHLETPVDAETAALLDRVLTEGPAAGVVVAAAIEPGGGGVAAVLGRFAHRWIFHLDDPADGPGLGVPIRRVPPDRPGAMVHVASGLDGLVADGIRPDTSDDGRTPPASTVGRRTPRVEPIEVLPSRILTRDPASTVPGSPTVGAMAPAWSGSRATVGSGAAVALSLPIGVGHRRFEPVAVELAPGDHLLVVGPPRSGRTTTLHRVASAWRAARPDGRIVVLRGRPPTSDDDPLVAWEQRGVAELAGELGSAAAVPLLVLVDDAERIDDDSGALGRALAADDRDLVIVASARADALRMQHGHWTTAVRRSRIGIVLTGGSDHDGELLSALLPRRCPLPARPGLAWSVGPPGIELVQIAMDPSVPPAPSAASSRGQPPREKPRRYGTTIRSVR